MVRTLHLTVSLVRLAQIPKTHSSFKNVFFCGGKHVEQELLNERTHHRRWLRGLFCAFPATWRLSFCWELWMRITGTKLSRTTRNYISPTSSGTNLEWSIESRVMRWKVKNKSCQFKALVRRDIFTHNIAIKRHCNNLIVKDVAKISNNKLITLVFDFTFISQHVSTLRQGPLRVILHFKL